MLQKIHLWICLVFVFPPNFFVLLLLKNKISRLYDLSVGDFVQFLRKCLLCLLLDGLYYVGEDRIAIHTMLNCAMCVVIDCVFMKHKNKNAMQRSKTLNLDSFLISSFFFFTFVSFSFSLFYFFLCVCVNSFCQFDCFNNWTHFPLPNSLLSFMPRLLYNLVEQKSLIIHFSHSSLSVSFFLSFFRTDRKQNVTLWYKTFPWLVDRFENLV